MALAGIAYDKCAYATELQENKNILEYTLSTDPYARCKECRPAFGIWGGNSVSRPPISVNMVELESELMGIRYPASRCPSKRYEGPNDKVLEDKRDYKCKDSLMTLDLNSKWLHLNECQIFNLQEVPTEGPVTIQGCKGGAPFK